MTMLIKLVKEFDRTMYIVQSTYIKRVFEATILLKTLTAESLKMSH